MSTLDVQSWPEVLPVGVRARPTRLGELMPVAARTDGEIAVELQRITQVEARLAAYRADQAPMAVAADDPPAYRTAALVGLADPGDCRSAAEDPPPF